jgi:hypothetical protein
MALTFTVAVAIPCLSLGPLPAPAQSPGKRVPRGLGRRKWTIRRFGRVAKVPLKANLQVTDSAHLLSAVFSVAFVITCETRQELYFQPFARLEGHSAPYLKNRC